jgi:hypothetical protein
MKETGRGEIQSVWGPPPSFIASGSYMPFFNGYSRSPTRSVLAVPAQFSITIAYMHCVNLLRTRSIHTARLDSSSWEWEEGIKLQFISSLEIGIQREYIYNLIWMGF